MKARSAIALAAAAVISGCGVPAMKLPSGPGAPAPDAATALADALGRCDQLHTLTAEIAVHGTGGGRRLHGRLTAGVARPASARIEAPSPFGQPLFIFVADGNDATLWLPRDQRVLAHAPPAAVLDAIAGIPLNASALTAAITACPEDHPDAAAARELGDRWRIVPRSAGDSLYLNRPAGTARWQLAAVTSTAPGGLQWRAEYRNFQQDGPHLVHLTSIGTAAFDLGLTLSQVETNAPLGADAFRVEVPASARPITVEELRRAGPFGISGGTVDVHAAR